MAAPPNDLPVTIPDLKNNDGVGIDELQFDDYTVELNRVILVVTPGEAMVCEDSVRDHAECYQHRSQGAAPVFHISPHAARNL